MNLADLLKQHQDLLDKAKTSIKARAVTADDLAQVPAVTKQRIAAVTVRIDDLQKQKASAIQRYDAAIAQQQVHLKQLQDAAARDEALTKAVQRPQGTVTEEAQKVADQLQKAKPARTSQRRDAKPDTKPAD